MEGIQRRALTWQQKKKNLQDIKAQKDCDTKISICQDEIEQKSGDK